MTLHIDPENDETADPCQKLPLRDEVMKMLEAHWQEIKLYKEIQHVNLHYLAGQINVDIYLPFDTVQGSSNLNCIVNDFSIAIKSVNYVNRIQVYYH